MNLALRFETKNVEIQLLGLGGSTVSVWGQSHS